MDRADDPPVPLPALTRWTGPADGDVLRAIATDAWVPPSGPAWLGYAADLVTRPVPAPGPAGAAPDPAGAAPDPVAVTARRLVVAALLHEFGVQLTRTGASGDWRHDLPGGGGVPVGESVLLEAVLDEAAAVRTTLLAAGPDVLLTALYATGTPGVTYPLSPPAATAAADRLAADESDGALRAAHWVAEGLPLL